MAVVLVFYFLKNAPNKLCLSLFDFFFYHHHRCCLIRCIKLVHTLTTRMWHMHEVPMFNSKKKDHFVHIQFNFTCRPTENYILAKIYVSAKQCQWKINWSCKNAFFFAFFYLVFIVFLHVYVYCSHSRGNISFF